ncbi:Alcohol dehydrogenase transcription factor Myb/SANT-like [Musa troglodytarum]|uniref:UMP kinase n=1 Tax=Musa troglodytarum TaxID=320322 RepID=A0A9E7EZZ7_9LILI|nr:Alcohol dehydrogenase transcription factor Myb/SANT-like [Musa troglodytarum]URD85954.1 Alcohol dehydrogenase transcription factor Myb/SANT-like [Musa troglodytarum]URD85955.1 Alcohol dehydrogenase transcription factor Myb/SANT-like [Musa troglodytarum]URD85957.1 Alcohol dehydrogenase transcription factor Myb/SANT-like [Musa troglodytarum]
MAYCDDDFALLGDEARSQPQPQPGPFSAAQRYLSSKPAPISLQPRPHHHPGAAVAAIDNSGKNGVVVDRGGDDHDGYGEAFGQTNTSKCRTAPGFHDQHCFADDDNPFAPQNPAADDEGGDDDGDADNYPEHKGAIVTASQHQQPHHRPPKRKDRDDLSDSESPYCYNSSGAANKKSRPMSSSGDYRKDREEWSDTAISSLLDTYTEKYVQLNRGNLRGRDWEDVATIVSERCNKQKVGKSVEQCKNKIDNLKKRYKVECQRLSSGGLPANHWPWFKKMEQLVGSSSSSSKAAPDDDKSITLGGSATVMRQIKRYPLSASDPVIVNTNSKMKALSNPRPRWKRVILKISGAALAGAGPQNVDHKVVMLIAKEIAIAKHAGVEVAIVVGGQNFFCGDTWIAATGIDRATTYQIGMMASLMNAIMLQALLENLGVEARIQSTLLMQEIAEPYIRRRAISHLEKGRVVIFGGAGGGTGNPLFSSDIAAALRASEIHADAVLKGTTADGFYGCHSSNSNSNAFEHISYRELVSRGFTAIDMAALNICEENNTPVVLFNLLEPGIVSRALCGDPVGTLIDQSGRIS